MNGALVVLGVNVAVAFLFAAAYAIIALAVRGQRRALWFSVGYLLGMVAPAVDFLIPLVGWSAPLEWLGYGSFLLATLAMSVTMCLFNGQRPPWRTGMAIFALGVAGRLAIWGRPPDTLVYTSVFQLPFVLAALLAVRTTLGWSRRPLALLLAGTLGLLALNFATKPLLAVAFGGRRTVEQYTSTTYALLSQASSGMLLLAAGLVLLLLVTHEAITRSERESETDPLSGLLNRRGFDRQAQAVLSRASAHGRPVTAAMFDLDYFKQVNDRWGHDIGDATIAAFATLLVEHLPHGAVIGRLGGEEFAVLLDGLEIGAAVRHAEAVRLAAETRAACTAAATTVSGGVAQAESRQSLADLLRKADQATYRAKQGGRNLICATDGVPEVERPQLRRVA